MMKEADDPQTWTTRTLPLRFNKKKKNCSNYN